MLQDNIIDKIINVNGIQYSYDVDRNKWLSVSRSNIDFGLKHKNITTPRWLSIAPGTYSNNIGYKLFDQSTILRAVAYAQNITTCEFEIYEGSKIFSVNLINQNSNDEILDIDIASGELKCKLNCDNQVDYPIIHIQIAVRL